MEGTGSEDGGERTEKVGVKWGQEGLSVFSKLVISQTAAGHVTSLRPQSNLILGASFHPELAQSDLLITVPLVHALLGEGRAGQGRGGKRGREKGGPGRKGDTKKWNKNTTNERGVEGGREYIRVRGWVVGGG